MSVRGVASHPSFPAFLQAHLDSRRNPHFRHAHPQQLRQFHHHHPPHLLPQQPTTVMQPANAGDFGLFGHDGASFGPQDNSLFFTESGTSSVASDNGNPSFEDFLPGPDDPHNVDLPSLSRWREPSVPDVLNVPFRPVGAVHGSFSSSIGSSVGGSFSESSMLGDANDNTILKIDNSPVFPNTQVTQVDTSKYENVEDSHWVLSCKDYEASSSPSVGDHSSDACSPMTPQSGNAFLRHYFDENHVAVLPGRLNISKPESSGIIGQYNPFMHEHQGLSFQGGCQCQMCKPPLTIPGPLTAIFNAGQTQPTGAVVPAFNNAYPGALATHTVPALNAVPIQYGTFPPPDQQPVAPQPINPLATSALLDTCDSALDTTPEMSDSGDDTEPDVNQKAVTEGMRRKNRDDYLVKMREKGHSYKEIKRLGRFKEAESTLRGRVRVLTKDKDQRVRKPEWTLNDLNLLERAVKKFAEGRSNRNSRENPSRMPWKKISDWMHKHGSSYDFASATCAKKWRALNGIS